MSRLGCGETRVVIANQCGKGGRVFSGENASSIEWNRVLDDVSEARIVIPVGGPGCCNGLENVYPWCHILEIYRDNELVWYGPVTNVTFTYTEVIIEARDQLAWLGVRVAGGVLDTNGVPMDIRDLAQDVIDAAVVDHDPCVSGNVVKIGSNPIGLVEVGSEDFPAYEGTYLDWLFDLSEIGLNFTTRGPQIFLSVEGGEDAAFGTLTDQHLMSQIEVSRDGANVVNRMFVRYQNDDDGATCLANAQAGNVPNATVPCPAIAESDDINTICYGPIERLSNEGVPFNVTTAQQAADLFVSAGSGQPLSISFPAGARLSPEFPVTLDQLVPGQRLRVALTELVCIPVATDFKIIEVRFLDDANTGGEEISLTLGPFNSIGTL